MEREDNAAARCKYLWLLTENKKSGNSRTEVYLDDTRVHQDEWTTADATVGVKLKPGKDL